MDGFRATELLSGDWNPDYWHLLWFFALPPLYLAVRWLYWRMRINAADEPVTYLDSNVDADKFTGVGGMIERGDIAPPPLDRRETDPADPFALARQVAGLMKRYPGWWCICGGWAVDLHLGRMTRTHEDIEIAVLRREQHLLWEYTLGWQPHYVVPGQPGLIAWQGARELELPVHELHTRPLLRDLTQLEILLNESTLDEWVYRRDERIRMPLGNAILVSAEGLPYLAPEIVLLYKSKQPQAKDERDFAALLPALVAPQRNWLRTTLETTSPFHPWTDRL